MRAGTGPATPSGIGTWVGHRRRATTWTGGVLAFLMIAVPASGQVALGAETPPMLDTLESREDNLAAVVDTLAIGEGADAADLTAEPWEPPADDDEMEFPAELPEADEQTVVLGAAGQGASAPGDESGAGGLVRTAAASTVTDAPGVQVTVGGLPLAIAPVERAPAPEAVTIRVADAAEAEAAGVTGVLIDLSDATPDAAQATEVEVTVSYADFVGLAGGDWASRLQVVEIPACAEHTPEAPECRPVPVESTSNDVADQTVTAVVELSPGPQVGPDGDAPAGTDQTASRARAATAASAGTVTTLAVTAGPSGSAGDWGATSLAPSASWGTSGGTGAFTWSYPLRVPVVPGGLAPELSLSYSSAVSDGRVASTNNQASWVGEGFDLTSSYVERTYVPCSEDRDSVDGSVPNNVTTYTGDLCWGPENATLALNGSAIELVKDAASNTWRSKNDDGARIEHKTGGWSQDDDKEYWVVTTVDGTTYYFGRDRLAADGDSLGSAWTVPVFGNHEGEPCYNASFKDSRCRQTWRWNLDHVVDPLGNTMTYRYAPDTAAYQVGVGPGVATYNPGGHLVRIDYGTRSGASSAPAARVELTAAPRCVGSAAECAPERMLSNKAKWPDVPTDLYCAADAATCPTQTTPVFFDRHRLTAITTKTFDGTTYQPVDSWRLAQVFRNPNGSSNQDGTGKVLWLKSITHTGHGGTAAKGDDLTLPSVELAATDLKNRVDSVTDGPPPMWRPRISSIRTESGALTSVNYAEPDCSATALPSDPRTNTKRCFPVDWDPEGHTKDRLDWFHKYVVASVVENGASMASDGERLATGSGQVTTRYTYGGGARWMKPTGPLVKPKEVTYSDFRGYASVTTTVGDGGEATSSTSRYFRGLGGELTASPGGTTVTATDHERLSGQVFSSEQKNGSVLLSQTFTVPGGMTTTATAKDGRKATRVGRTEALGFSYRQDGTLEQSTRTTSTYDANNQVVTIDDAGDLATPDDDLCTRLTYAHTGTSTLAETYRAAHMLSLPSRTEVVSKACTDAPVRPRDVVSDTLATYDAKGQALQTWEVAADLDRATGTLTPSSKTGYTKTQEVLSHDAWGRVTKVSDALGRVTTTAYTHSEGGLLRQVVTTSPDPDGAGSRAGLTSTTVFNPLVGTVLETRDANGRKTTGRYDALGRLLEVRYPDRQGKATPSVAYEYVVKANGLNSVVTKTLGADGSTQHVQSVLYDGLMRAFQTQTESVDAGSAHNDSAAVRGRVITHSFYDTAGRVHKQTGQWWAKGAPSATPVVAPPVTPSATTVVYDGAGRPTDQILWNGTDSNAEHEQWRTVIEYDGRYTTVVPPAGGTATTTVVDGRGRTTELREHLVRPAVTKGAPGASSTLGSFDPRTAAAASYQATRYSYDAAGQLTTMKNPTNHTWSYTYDFAGQQVRATDPDSGTTTTVYDVGGQVTSVTNGEGKTLAYSYDGLGRTTHVTENGDTRASWTYDTARDTAGNAVLGMVASATRHDGEAQYTTSVGTYDEAYRPLSSTVTLPASGDLAALTSRSFTTRYAYTADGQVEALTLPKITSAGASGGTTVLGQEQVTTYFDSASMPRWMAGGFGWGTYVAESRFTAFGQPLLTDLGNTYGAVVSYRYDEVTNRLTNVALKREQVVGTDLAVTYGYDAAGNVTSVLDRPTNAALGGAAAVDNQCFAYDGLRRLTAAWTAKDAATCAVAPDEVRPELVGGASPYWTQYEYDPLGNRTVKVDHATDGSAGSTTTRYSYGEGRAGPHALTSMTRSVDEGAAVAAGTFTYDRAGNQTSRHLPGSPKQLLGWDGEGELAQVTTTGSGTSGEDSLEDGEATFVYDAGGERLTRADASGTTVYLPGGQELHVDPSGVVSARRYYSFAGQTVAMRTGGGLGGVTSLVNDAHGTPLVAVPNTTWTPTSVERVYTDPFGAVRGGGSSSAAGDHQFLGKSRDGTTGLTLLGARYYDELVGRFISVDPVLDPGTPAQFNAYVYSGNNPLTWSDPSGLFWDEVKKGWNSATSAVGGFVKKHQAEIVGAVVGGATFVGCMAATAGAGSIGCGAAAGAAGGAATNLWRTKVQKTQEFSWGSLAFDTGIGAVTGLIGGPVGGMAVRAATPTVRAAASSVASAIQSVAPRASAAVASAARSAASFVRASASAARGRLPSAGARPSPRTSTPRAGGACSFAGSTGVLLADGTSKAISEIQPGEKVQAADPATGEAGPREVEAVHVHEDVMVTLVVDGRQIRTTEDHPFWSVTDQRFERADHLEPGELVLTADGQTAAVDAIETSDVIYDAAYNLTVADLHTYHVLTGQPATAVAQRGSPGAPRAVLVHNCAIGGGGVPHRGTVWDDMVATADAIPGTGGLPKSFELTAGDTRVWVHGNVTDHLADAARGAARRGHSPEMVGLGTQQRLRSLHAAVTSATRGGVRLNQRTTVGGWELEFRQRAGDALPALIHGRWGG